MIVIRLLAAAGLTAAALVSAQIASATPEDDAFLEAVESQGISFPSEEYAVNTAKQICQLINDGRSPTSVATEISSNSELDVETTGFFVGAAIGAYCPWNKPAEAAE